MTTADRYADEVCGESCTDAQVAETINDFCAGWRAADSHPAWIPVEDYPKVDISCTLLVHYVDGTIDICDYYGDYYDYTGENVTRNVTHWMPLPTPPQRKEE